MYRVVSTTSKLICDREEARGLEYTIMTAVGEILGHIKIRREVLQGESLSPPLFVITTISV